MIFNLSCFVSPVLVKVYDVFPLLMYGQVRQPWLELQRNVPAGGLGVLSLFASFARRFGERRKATTGTSLKMFLKRSVDCRMGCYLRSMSWMLGGAGLQVNVKGIRSLVSPAVGLFSFKASVSRNLFCSGDLFFYEASFVTSFYKVIF